MEQAAEQWPAKCQQQQAAGTAAADRHHNGSSNGADVEEAAASEDTTATSNQTERTTATPSITISEKSKQKIQHIMEQINALTPIEKYIFNLKYPSETSNVIDPFRQPLNPLGSRSEIYRTISWIKTHLEEDQDTSLPKQEVYDEYYRFCDDNKFKQLSQADFGKAMKQVYPNVRARRLGTRGKSRYCYSGLRRCLKLNPPVLPDLSDRPMSTEAPFTHTSNQSAWLVVKEWAKQQLSEDFASLSKLALHLVLNFSICEGSDFAYKLQQADTNLKEETNGKVDSKHKEMKMHLQRTIQQSRERKRKIQVPIAKLPQQQLLPQHAAAASVKKQPKNTKYKAIQPKIEPCDIASYNRVAAHSGCAPDDHRSQDVHDDIDRFKERKLHAAADDCDPSDFPLPRERLNSISNVEKDAMDEYLGTNNSQHDEELSKYFSNNNVQADAAEDNLQKLTHLRHILQQNGQDASNKFANPILQPSTRNNNPYTTIQPPNTIGATNRRRVSFETRPDEPVPPSPNTRRKHFSFTPISPGPQSPNGSLQSKCSSTNASPFVSPRNTPVPRMKNNAHQNAGIMLPGAPNKPLKVKKELSLDMPSSGDMYGTTPMLQKLLNSKTSYKPTYAHSHSLNLQSDVSTEVSQLLTNQIATNLSDMTFRSQSVPVNQVYNPYMGTFGQKDFTEVDPIPETDSSNVKQIIDALEEPSCDNNNIDLLCQPEFGLHLSNDNMDLQYSGYQLPPSGLQGRSLGRSQSIDVHSFQPKCANPSRSVPNTPLPFTNPILKPEIMASSSRSYPSTPLNAAADAFNYNVNGDCLLNGQPIRTDDLEHDLDFIDYPQMDGDSNLEAEKPYNLDGQEFIVDNDSSLMEGVLMEQYSNSIN